MTFHTTLSSYKDIETLNEDGKTDEYCNPAERASIWKLEQTFYRLGFSKMDANEILTHQVRQSCLIFNNISEQCFSKCVIRLDDDRLTNREKDCANKCYDKIWSSVKTFRELWDENDKKFERPIGI
ncbi:uncharacterized protein [Argopecten irradians]|uniref:uncharacterized protein isoform X1 n=1 Tax=Argopecten irradians TaxID=31199 RepID=UPI00371117D8